MDAFAIALPPRYSRWLGVLISVFAFGFIALWIAGTVAQGEGIESLVERDIHRLVASSGAEKVLLGQGSFVALGLAAVAMALSLQSEIGHALAEIRSSVVARMLFILSPLGLLVAALGFALPPFIPALQADCAGASTGLECGNVGIWQE